MKEVEGIVIELKDKGLDNPTVAVVEYQVEGQKYVLEESLKLKSKTIKLGFLPIGQKKTPAIECEKGKTVIIEYDEKNPKKANIKGNKGIINC